MPENDMPDAVTEKRKGIPIVWLLPFIALLIGSWLFYQSLLEAPEEIRIQFPTAEGIVPDKTEVRFKGIPIGRVKSMAVNEGLQSVVVTIDIDRNAALGMVEGTEFWMVTPSASLAGVSGLDTLLSGAYINVAPGDLDAAVPKREFVALDKPRPLDFNVPGLHLSLEAKVLGSLFVDAPILYNDFSIGSVQAYKLHDNGQGVLIDIFIKPEFSYLVSKNSRFYNSSGVTFSGDLTGFELKLDSLAALLVGGITLQNGNEKQTADTSSTVSNGDMFQLYESFKAARAGEYIQLRLPAGVKLVANQTKIRYKGYDVGLVDSVQLSSDMQTSTARVLMNPRAIPYLNTGARFWVVKPQLSLTEITGLETLLTGSYVAMGIGDGEAQREFEVLMEPPPPSYDLPGLHIKLRASTMSSIEGGTQVLFRKIPVGKVQNFKLLSDSDILIDLFIEPEYAHLVTKKSRFWNASGIEISGGLSGLKLRTESLSSIVRGGVSFSSDANSVKGKPAVNGDIFDLYNSAGDAAEQGVEILLDFDSGEGLSVGMQIKYMGMSVGKVKSVNLNEAMTGIIITALLDKKMERLAVEGSQFWLVKPKLGLTNSANLGTLVSGRYIAIKPGKGSPLFYFNGLEAEPLGEIKQHGLNIVLTTGQLGSLKAGVKLFYRGVPVGEITGYDLSNNADYVRVYVNIRDSYRVLVRENTVFWNISGVDLSFGLFRGAKLETNSLESILGGGIAFATPDTTPLTAVASTNTVYKLEDKVKDEWMRWKAAISLKSAPKNKQIGTGVE